MRTFEELKLISQNENFKKLMDELKINGLDTVLNIKMESSNYVTVLVNVLAFFDNNKNVFKNIDAETKEDILVLCIDEILERNGIFIEDEVIEEYLRLLKNSYIVQEGVEFLYEIVSSFMKRVYTWFKTKFNKNKK